MTVWYYQDVSLYMVDIYVNCGLKFGRNPNNNDIPGLLKNINKRRRNSHKLRLQLYNIYLLFVYSYKHVITTQL